MHHIDGNVTDELVDVRHRIYHTPEFRRNIDHLLCLQNMEIRQRNLLRPDRLAKLAGTPTLIIWGHENPFGDVPEAHAMHDDIPGSRLELYAECGHWPQYEHPELYNPMSIAFFAGATRCLNAPGSRDACRRIGEAIGIDLDPDAAAFFAEQIDATLREYYWPLDAMGGRRRPPVRFPRTPGTDPRPPTTRSTRGTGAPRSPGTRDGPARRPHASP